MSAAANVIGSILATIRSSPPGSITAASSPRALPTTTEGSTGGMVSRSFLKETGRKFAGGKLHCEAVFLVLSSPEHGGRSTESTLTPDRASGLPPPETPHMRMSLTCNLRIMAVPRLWYIPDTTRVPPVSDIFAMFPGDEPGCKFIRSGESAGPSPGPSNE